MYEKIIKQYDEYSLVRANGFDEAVIGIEESSMRLIYSVSKCISVIMREETAEDALEYFTFNVIDNFKGQKPIFCNDNIYEY